MYINLDGDFWEPKEEVSIAHKIILDIEFSKEEKSRRLYLALVLKDHLVLMVFLS
jgi:hypothetical protein